MTEEVLPPVVEDEDGLEEGTGQDEEPEEDPVE